MRIIPHLAGTISDLDNKIQRNLIALENELSRRKELLDRYGVKNINDYLKLQRAGGAQEQLSYLFVVIDEFAEFKIQFPDFYDSDRSDFCHWPDTWCVCCFADSEVSGCGG